jgi:hypothetical protein
VTKESNDPTIGTDSSEFIQLLRNFANLIREIRASDLSTSDRAELHSLLDTLAELKSPMAADPMHPPPESC